MSDLISKRAAQAIKVLPKCYREYKTDILDDAYEQGWTDAMFSLNALPTIDAVPVVRCRDCKWWGLSPYNTLGIHVCKKYRGVRCEIDYCSRAERSEE